MKSKACLSFTLSLLALFLMCGLSASAQDQVAAQPTTSAVPNLLRYGGVLKDANGAVLASQTVGITFALYKQQDGGVALWTETRNVTTDAAGQYSVMLGSTKSEGVPAELFSDQEQRWLAVQVQGQPEPSRVLLVSVPYAFKAHEAETLGGLPASAFVKAATMDGTSGYIYGFWNFGERFEYHRENGLHQRYRQCAPARTVPPSFRLSHILGRYRSTL